MALHVIAVLLAADAAKTIQLGVVQDGVVVQTLFGTNYGFCRTIPEYIDLIECGVGHSTSVIVDCIVACALLYFAITYVLLLSKLRGYRKQPYTFVQVGLVYNTLQVGLMAMHACNFIHNVPAPRDYKHYCKVIAHAVKLLVIKCVGSLESIACILHMVQSCCVSSDLDWSVLAQGQRHSDLSLCCSKVTQ